MYEKLSKSANEFLREKSLNKDLSPYAFRDENALRRRTDTHDNADFLRTPFVRDADKIINCPFFSRYADKTQVFSLVKNDDVSRRSLHVQLVSRIARNIGNALSLNCELIEAIANDYWIEVSQPLQTDGPIWYYEHNKPAGGMLGFADMMLKSSQEEVNKTDKVPCPTEPIVSQNALQENSAS